MSFTPGLLINQDKALTRFASFAGPSGVVVPPYIDHRFDMLPASNQGDTPRCAAYAMAGIVEYYRWRLTGTASQVDPNPIYDYAKKIDGDPNADGTTLEAVVQAAIALELMPIKPNSIQVVRSSLGVKRAIHRYGPILSGFMINEGWMTVGPDGWIQDQGAEVGGHAVVLCGYADDEPVPYYEIQNSWGESGVGWRGFMRMNNKQFVNGFAYALVWDVLY